MLNCLGKNVRRFVEIIAGVKPAIDLRAVTRPFLDFVEVARIGDQRVFGFLVGPIVRHCIKDSTPSSASASKPDVFWRRMISLQASHLGTLAAVGLVACAGLTMMRQEERSLRTIIVVMVNTPLRSGMVLKIGMEGSDLGHLLSFGVGTELPRGIWRGQRL
jgi:hypothetical protein